MLELYGRCKTALIAIFLFLQNLVQSSRSTHFTISFHRRYELAFGEVANKHAFVSFFSGLHTYLLI